jgi:pimeloyl-ACP methyl ester carboxylesterase
MGQNKWSIAGERERRLSWVPMSRQLVISLSLCLTLTTLDARAQEGSGTQKLAISAATDNNRLPTKHSVQTRSGRISYMEQGKGPVALFVHGVLMNGYLWRHQLSGLSDIRRCIAVDLLAHGDTEIAPNQDVSVTANAEMLKQFLDALNIDQVDLIGNDSGSGIAQIFAALYPERIRSLTLTDGDTHDYARKPIDSVQQVRRLRIS